MYYDFNYWSLMLPVFFLSCLVQAVLNSKFNRYSKVGCRYTGAEVARMMLEDQGIHDVQVSHVSGRLTDHYNPETRIINLSDGVYSSHSIAAVAVAAHETGHAVQHHRGYAPLKMRSLLVPVVNFANNIVWILLLLGLFVINVFPGLFWGGVALFAVTTLFSLVTLPVEVDASRRAISWLQYADITDDDTLPMAKSALRWAACTYFVAALGSIATVIYYIGLGKRSN